MKLSWNCNLIFRLLPLAGQQSSKIQLLWNKGSFPSLKTRGSRKHCTASRHCGTDRYCRPHVPDGPPKLYILNYSSILSCIIFFNPNTTNGRALIRSTIQRDTRKGQCYVNYGTILNKYCTLCTTSVYRCGLDGALRKPYILLCKVSVVRAHQARLQHSCSLLASTIAHCCCLLVPRLAAAARVALGAARGMLHINIFVMSFIFIVTWPGCLMELFDNVV